jgi:hypothetical protein
VLYQLVRQNLESFLAYAREHYDCGLPRYVERELRAYLSCGDFSEGFTRAHCRTCGHDLLVAFSCHGRSICPSCCGRRMANVAAHLVDRVLPDVPVRQYVLTLPYELRRLAAFKADVLTALARIFVEAVFARYRSRAGCDGIEDPQCGSVNFVQRFGSLNLHVHFHLLALDGVFARDAVGGLVFHPAEAPTAADLDAIVARTARRSIAWLRKRGYIDDSPLEARSNEEPAQTALDACAAIAMGRGNVSTLPRDDTKDDGHGAAEERPDKPALAVERDGCKVGARRRARLSPGRFPSAPFRTRRAPFVEHRALHRWHSELRGCLLTQLEGAYAYARHFEWEDVTVPPTKLSSAWLAPAVSRRNDPPVCAAVLLLDPSKDGPPQVVVERAEDTLRSPRMAVEVAETAQNQVQHAQVLTKAAAPPFRAELPLDALA